MFLKSKEEICAKHQKQTVTTPSVIAEVFHLSLSFSQNWLTKLRVLYLFL